MKPGVYLKFYVHIIFSPRGRESLLPPLIREKVHKYIYGIIQNKGCKPIAINGTEDHIHILAGMNPVLSVSDLVKEVKRASSVYINNELSLPYHFNWQEGYGAFSVGFRELDTVFKYILNQENHHSSVKFKEEYKKILSDQDFQFNESFLFEFYD